MRRMMAQAIELPPQMLRIGGLVMAVVGFWGVWLIRG